MHIEIGDGGRDWYDAVTLIVGLCATIIAGLGGAIALRSYVATNRANAHAHMHHMFERFLAARDEHAASLERPRRRMPGRRREPTSLREDSDFGGSVLYYLEEVHAWIEMEDRFLKGWIDHLLFPFAGRDRRRRLDVTASWRATLTSQVISHRQDVLASLLDYSSCYGASFLLFAAGALNEPRLTRMARASARAVETGRPRPLGRRERQQRADVAGRLPDGPFARAGLFLVGLALLSRRHAGSTHLS